MDESTSNSVMERKQSLSTTIHTPLRNLRKNYIKYV